MINLIFTYIDKNQHKLSIPVNGAMDKDAAKAEAEKVLKEICKINHWDVADYHLGSVEALKTRNPEYEAYLLNGLNDPRD